MAKPSEPFITKPLLLLTIGHAITDLSQGALPAILPFIQNSFQLTYAQIGMIVLMQNLTSSVIQPLFGAVTDRVSLPWLLPVSMVLSGLGLALTGLASSYQLILATVVLGGLGIACFHPQASKTAHFVSGASKGRSMGIFSVGGNLGLAIGSMFITFLLGLPGGLANTMYFFLPGVLMAILLWRHLPDLTPTKAIEAAATRHASQPKKPIPYGLVAALLTYIFFRSSVHAGLSTYIPLYYVNYLAGSPMYASYLLSAFFIAGVVGTYVGGTLSDRFGRKTVILGSMITTMPLISLFPYTSGLLTIVLLALTGLVLIASFSTTVVLAQEMMPGYEGMASGLTIGFSIGLGGIGATLLGYVADHYGIPSIFSILTVLPLIGAGFASFLPGKIFKAGC